jgi:hypothetical protein
MANQMIALQARSPQLPDPARATTQMANMMNMARQQEAAQLQGERIRQEMEYAQAGETRAQKKAELEYVGLVAKQFEQDVAKLADGNIAGAEALRANIVREIPAWDKFISPASEWTPEYKARLSLKAKEIYDKVFPDVTASKEYAAGGGVDAQGRPVPEGTVLDVRIGGFPGAAGTSAVPVTGATAPRATPTAPPTSAMGREPSAASDAPMTFGPDATRPLNEYQQEDLRNLESQLGMQDTPASFTRGGMGAPAAAQMTPERAQQIVDSAVRSRVMAQEDFDQLMAMAPEQNKQAFTDMIRTNNITLQPSGMGQQSQFAVTQGQRPQADFAVNRGAPPPATLAQYQPVQRRDPNQPIAPGSSVVPLGRLKAEADVRRETPAQIQARKTAELQAAEEFEEANKDARLGRKRQEVFEGERAKKDAAFLDTYSDATTKSRTTLNVIDQMIGDARIEKDRLVVPKGGRRPHPGFEGVVGMGIPGVRLFPGTAAASFDALFEQAEGGAFLQAYESLRGTGQITEIEGTKATSALTRMKRSQSEAEFVKAAREFADVLRAGVARADKRYTRLTGEAPPPAPTQRKTPTSRLSAETRAKYGL